MYLSAAVTSSQLPAKKQTHYKIPISSGLFSRSAPHPPLFLNKCDKPDTGSSHTSRLLPLYHTPVPFPVTLSPDLHESAPALTVIGKTILVCCPFAQHWTFLPLHNTHSHQHPSSLCKSCILTHIFTHTHTHTHTSNIGRHVCFTTSSRIDGVFLFMDIL